MVNETLFLTQTACVILVTLHARQLGSGALVASTAIQALLANLFVLKQITLWGLEITASEPLMIGSLLSLLLLREDHGKQESDRAVTTSFLFLLFFAVISQLHLLYVPNPHDRAHAAFSLLLSPSPRLFLASLFVFGIVQRFDVWCFGKFKAHWPLALRTACALTLSQLLDTVLFSFAGLYGIVSSLVHVIVVSLLLKFIVIFLFTAVMHWKQHSHEQRLSL